MGRMLFREGSITPEEREQFYDRVTQNYLERSSRYYSLSEPQKEQVKATLERLKAEQREYTEPRMAQVESLRQQMRDVFRQSRETGQWDRQRMQELGQQAQALWNGAPLLNRQMVADRIEQILPPEQAEQGRARRLQDEAAWAQERSERMRRFEGRMQQQEQAGPSAEGQPADEGSQEGQRRRVRRERPNGEARPGDGRDRREDGDGGRNRRGRGEQRDEQNSPQPAYNPDDALGPWERYVRDFIRRYQLDESQQASARSVLREAQEQRVLYESTKRTDFEAARQLADASLRQQQLDALQAPVRQMFEVLKMQLERIPTFAQKMAAGSSPPATQPVVAAQVSTSTQPSGGQPQTRPSREGRRFEREGGQRERSGGRTFDRSGDRPRNREGGGRRGE